VPVRAKPDSRPCLEGACYRNTRQAAHSYSSPPSPYTSLTHTYQFPSTVWARALDRYMVSALGSRVGWTSASKERTNERSVINNACAFDTVFCNAWWLWASTTFCASLWASLSPCNRTFSRNDFCRADFVWYVYSSIDSGVYPFITQAVFCAAAVWGKVWTQWLNCSTCGTSEFFSEQELVCVGKVIELNPMSNNWAMEWWVCLLQRYINQTLPFKCLE